jgi:putative DNA primase/helicase
LTGLTTEQCLFFPYGTGKNGKSLFVETLRKVAGDYWMKAPASMLMAKRGDVIPNDVARLVGARMVVASETAAERRLDEALVKDLTGYDTVTARFLHKEFFEFKPTGKLWIYGNAKPVIRGSDDGIWRRIRLVPFTERFYSPDDADYDPKGPQADPDLAKQLEAELPGILAWLVDGCLLWQRDGPGMPQAVQQATQRYRQEMDVVGAFLEECCVVLPERPDIKAPTSEIYAAYLKWCSADRGEVPLKSVAFNQLVEKHGVVKKRSTAGKYYWYGLGLLDQYHF